jgi:hypothetical protein
MSQLTNDEFVRLNSIWGKFPKSDITRIPEEYLLSASKESTRVKKWIANILQFSGPSRILFLKTLLNISYSREHYSLVEGANKAQFAADCAQTAASRLQIDADEKRAKADSYANSSKGKRANQFSKNRMSEPVDRVNTDTYNKIQPIILNSIMESTQLTIDTTINNIKKQLLIKDMKQKLKMKASTFRDLGIRTRIKKTRFENK